MGIHEEGAINRLTAAVLAHAVTVERANHPEGSEAAARDVVAARYDYFEDFVLGVDDDDVETGEVVVSGLGDDLIRVEGAITAEITAHGTQYVAIGDDWIISAHFSGTWELEVAEHPVDADWEHYNAGIHDEARDYSEALVFEVPTDAEVREV